MSESRDKMYAALKAIVLPRLRRNGFTGSLPHLRRIRATGIDLITFQFDKWGGGFVIEVARCGAEGFTTSWGKHIPPKHVTAWNLHPNERTQIQPGKGGSTNDWFRYDGPTAVPSVFEQVANSVLTLLPSHFTEVA